VSADGGILLLLLSMRDTYVAVINVRTSKMLHELQVSGCYEMLLSPNADYICTSSVHDNLRVVTIFMHTYFICKCQMSNVNLYSALSSKPLMCCIICII